jgi:hypothetical protein
MSGDLGIFMYQPCNVPKPSMSVVTWGFVDSECS